jgi:hypothetical protein
VIVLHPYCDPPFQVALNSRASCSAKRSLRRLAASPNPPDKIKPGGTSSRGTGHPPRIVSRRSNSTPHHPGISVASHSWPCFKLCGGNIRHEFFAHCSTTELRLLSPPAGIEPATHGSDVTCAFATPKTFRQNRACTHTFSTHTRALSCTGGAPLL